MWTILAFFVGLLIGLVWMYCIDMADIVERDRRILELEAINEELRGEGDESFHAGFVVGQSRHMADSLEEAA